jgi:undecaprenyl-diphosphatase
MQTLGSLAAQHPDWVTVAAFVTAFLESLVVISFLVPGTTVLLGIGMIVAAASLPIEPVLVAASLGAIAGNGISFWLGRLFGSRLYKVWPLRSDPVLAADAQAFFRNHGFGATLLSRFVAPLRAVVPFAAGMLGMRQLPFWLSSVGAAVVSVSGTFLLGVALYHVLRPAVESDAIVVLAAVFVLGTAVLAASVVSFIAKTSRSSRTAVKA